MYSNASAHFLQKAVMCKYVCDEMFYVESYREVRNVPSQSHDPVAFLEFRQSRCFVLQIGKIRKSRLSL